MPIAPDRPQAVSLAHAVALAELHASVFAPREAWDAHAFAGQLEQPPVFGLVSGEVGLILARAIADQSEILTLAVLPGARRRGVGTALLRAAMGVAAERGATTMYLEVSAKNAGALALYEATGFRRVGRRANYYPDGADGLILAAAITVSAEGAA